MKNKESKQKQALFCLCLCEHTCIVRNLTIKGKCFRIVGEIPTNRQRNEGSENVSSLTATFDTWSVLGEQHHIVDNWHCCAWDHRFRHVWWGCCVYSNNSQQQYHSLSYGKWEIGLWHYLGNFVRDTICFNMKTRNFLIFDYNALPQKNDGWSLVILASLGKVFTSYLKIYSILCWP